MNFYINSYYNRTTGVIQYNIIDLRCNQYDHDLSLECQLQQIMPTILVWVS